MCIALPPPKPETSTRTPWTHKVTWWASGTGLHWVFIFVLCFVVTVQLWWFIVVIFMFKNLGLVILVRYSKENNYNYK